VARTTIDLSCEGKIARLTFNRPEKRNAFDDTMLNEFEDAVAEVSRREDVCLLIIRGSGGSFSAGYDVAPAPRREPNAPRGPRPDILRDRDRLQDTLRRWMLVRDLPQPVIAQVQGHCIGGATQLCMMCDLIVAADEARIAWPGLPLGGGFISPIWAWLVGPSRAKYMSFRPGSAINGREAAEWGWATLAVPEAQLEAEVERVAREIVRVPREVLRVKKLAINRQMDIMGFSTAVQLGVEWDAILHESDAVKEMRALVREKGIRGAIDEFRGGAS
jgi:enoyl-CoA hydratase